MENCVLCEESHSGVRQSARSPPPEEEGGV